MERYILIGLVVLNLGQVLVMAFHYAMNIRVRRQQQAFDLEWQLIPYDFRTDWFTKPENLIHADLQNIDKGVVTSPKIFELPKPLVDEESSAEAAGLNNSTGLIPGRFVPTSLAVPPSIK